MVMVRRITLWSPKAQIILPFHHNDNYQCRHTTTITSPIHCCLQYPFFFSLSDSSEQRAQHQRKLANVQHLVQQYTMTAILETHVTGAKAELFFCRYVEGTRRFFIHGMAVIVQETWVDHFNPALVTVVDGVIVAIVWEYDGSKHFAFFFPFGRTC